MHLLHIEKCQCGHRACNYYGLSLGSFDQGTGFDFDTAVEICLALRDRYPEKYAFDEAAAMYEKYGNHA